MEDFYHIHFLPVFFSLGLVVADLQQAARGVPDSPSKRHGGCLNQAHLKLTSLEAPLLLGGGGLCGTV